VESFTQKLAVVTGGGSGMGREIVLQLATDGCSVATCDLNSERVSETAGLAEVHAPDGASVTAHTCDVSDERQVLRFRDEVIEQHATDRVDLLFNNAGIGGGGSLITDSREVWERTFAIDWWGVYFCTRAFLPLLMRSTDAMLVNTSSVNGFFASLGPGVPHTAYSTAKFAVKGFSEALIEDLRVNAPHVKVALVMPGHIGTDIVINSQLAHGLPDLEDMAGADIEPWRAELVRRGLASPDASLDDLHQVFRKLGDDFKNNAPLSAAEGAAIILQGVKDGKWRILVGKDAEAVDEAVRADPENSYNYERFFARLGNRREGS
jgi:NAD(P)-dependent dehydrogenase (short-subunit alcohol dehydrogenase family)